MRFLVFLIICAALALVGYSVASTHTGRGRKGEMETFLRRIADGHAGEAYDSATEDFKRRFPWEEYQRFVENFHLTRYRPDSLRADTTTAEMETASWRQGFSRVEIEGKAALRDDTRFRIVAKLRLERGAWRVDYLYITVPRPRAARPPAGTDDAPRAEHPADEPRGPTLTPGGKSPAGNATPADVSPPPVPVPSPPPARPGA